MSVYSFTLIGLVPILLIVLGAAVLEVRKKRKYGQNQLGIDSGQGDSLVEGGAGASFGGSGGGHNTVIRVPRNPQEYAKAFVPDNARKSK